MSGCIKKGPDSGKEFRGLIPFRPSSLQEPDAFPGWGRRLHEIPDGIKDSSEAGIIALFECGDLSGEAFNGESHAAQFHKGGNNSDTDLDSLRTVKDCGDHDGAVFRKSIRWVATPASGL